MAGVVPCLSPCVLLDLGTFSPFHEVLLQNLTGAISRQDLVKCGQADMVNSQGEINTVCMNAVMSCFEKGQQWSGLICLW